MKHPAIWRRSRRMTDDGVNARFLVMPSRVRALRVGRCNIVNMLPEYGKTVAHDSIVMADTPSSNHQEI